MNLIQTTAAASLALLGGSAGFAPQSITTRTMRHHRPATNTRLAMSEDGDDAMNKYSR